MDINIVTTDIEEDFSIFFNTLVDKFKLKNTEEFKNELLTLVDNLNLNKSNDLDILEEKYYNIIDKYSSSNTEELVNEALNERKLWTE